MQTPKRKPGKYTYLKIDPNLTQAKYRELTGKLEKLKQQHPLAAKEVMRLGEMGDFSENHAYQMAKGRLRGLNQRIRDLEDLLGQAIIIKPKKSSKIIQLGSKVIIKIDGKQQAYQILGSSETDPVQGIISHTSPMGSALLGHAVGDSVPVQQANELVECRILKIE